MIPHHSSAARKRLGRNLLIVATALILILTPWIVWLNRDRDTYYRLSATIEFGGETIVHEGIAKCLAPGMTFFLPRSGNPICSDRRIGIPLPDGSAVIVEQSRGQGGSTAGRMGGPEGQVPLASWINDATRPTLGEVYFKPEAYDLEDVRFRLIDYYTERVERTWWQRVLHLEPSIYSPADHVPWMGRPNGYVDRLVGYVVTINQPEHWLAVEGLPEYLAQFENENEPVLIDWRGAADEVLQAIPMAAIRDELTGVTLGLFDGFSSPVLAFRPGDLCHLAIRASAESKDHYCALLERSAVAAVIEPGHYFIDPDITPNANWLVAAIALAPHTPIGRPDREDPPHIQIGAYNRAVEPPHFGVSGHFLVFDPISRVLLSFDPFQLTNPPNRLEMEQ